ncbi:hypothetical protein [Microcoleus sp. herbarium14]|uniref:hypothetical protein n=1 Tax=Microcoleus sp. herbarium14 TaxID=3055439 RepID=UPI002FD5D0F5
MNPLLNNYCVSVDFPDVSGAEHLEMLQIRDRLAESESQLSEEEKISLAKADGKLIEHVNVFYQELSRFVDLTEIRKAEAILPQRWWWYLDVLVFLPISLKYELKSRNVEMDEVLAAKEN